MQLGFGKWNILSIHLQGSPVSATWINIQPCLKTVFRERCPDFQTRLCPTPHTAQWDPSHEVFQHHHKGKQYFCLPLHRHSPRGAKAGWWWWWCSSSRVWEFCSTLTCPAHSDHAVLSVMEMCSQSSEGSAQFSHLTSQGRFADFEQTHSHRIFHKSSVHVAWSDYQPHTNFRIFPVLSVDL